MERDSLWKNAIMAMHGLRSKWMSKDPRESYGTGL